MSAGRGDTDRDVFAFGASVRRMMTPEDLALARSWIGRTLTIEDAPTPHLARAFHATFDPHLAPRGSDDAPLGLHWCLAFETAAMAGLDQDGHITRGAFWPPCPLPKRMAAGGDLDIVAPIRMSAPLRRISTIEDVALRDGKSGQLCFVTVKHVFESGGQAALTETQNVVFRAEGSAAASKLEKDEEPAELSAALNADEALLFRYSALTFNAHRIHYDRAYAAYEGYPGLVVHGPLQATLLLNLAARLLGQTPRRFVFRAQAPIIDGPFEIGGRVTGEGAAAVWTRNAQGGRAMSATASL